VVEVGPFDRPAFGSVWFGVGGASGGWSLIKFWLRKYQVWRGCTVAFHAGSFISLSDSTFI
jgi:hypothetical protein